MIDFKLDDTFNKELPADGNLDNHRRQVHEACYSFVKPKVPSSPVLLHVSEEMLHELGLEAHDATDKDFLDVFSGAKVVPESRPYAMCYGGHQFGSWAGQLGDGRAINLFEITHGGKRWALQLKGSGSTPYSRTADGLAVLRSSIREHLCSEAMYHLGVPTTRSLCIITTGDQVLRDIMYNGNAAFEKGAVICRAAPSFIRFGNFQIFAARNDLGTLELLLNYTIRHFFPQIRTGSKGAYIQFFREVARMTLDMVIHWQRVGFVHGVMNTDNMSILGLTIDYGPYGWLEGYDPDWTPNTTDKSTRRYRYGHQPSVALWNLSQLANALFPLIKEEQPFREILEEFKKHFYQAYASMMRSKLGLMVEMEDDVQLISDLEENLSGAETDMTIFFRNLSSVKKQGNYSIEDFLEDLRLSLYSDEAITIELNRKWTDWFERYQLRLGYERLEDHERKSKMDAVNPKYVLRNYMAQLAIDQANEGDYKLMQEFYLMLKRPYDEQPDQERWFAKRPEWARKKVGCSMLSCSS